MPETLHVTKLDMLENCRVFQRLSESLKGDEQKVLTWSLVIVVVVAKAEEDWVVHATMRCPTNHKTSSQFPVAWEPIRNTLIPLSPVSRLV